MMHFWAKIKSGLKKTKDNLETKVKSVFKFHKISQGTLDDFEDVLIEADFGVEVAGKLRQALEKKKGKDEISAEEVQTLLAKEIEEILAGSEKHLSIDTKPYVFLMIGVNGVGKTTTISKIAQQFLGQGYTVAFAACDTFRAGATEQLEEWASRLNIPLYKTKPGGDPSGLAYEALDDVKKKGIDILIIDTAGRLHNKQNLMDELKKIATVIKKVVPAAPHETLLVLDATTGQNMNQQVKIFQQNLLISSLVLTKLDGTAKGGAIVGVYDAFHIPICAVGVGETEKDLLPFSKKLFSVLSPDGVEAHDNVETQNKGKENL